MRRVHAPEFDYVRCVLDGRLSREDFVRTQAQFLFAVEPYADYLALLAARCESAHQRRVLEQIVHDERGGDDPSEAHSGTFRTLLARLGVTTQQIDGTPPWPCVDAFNAGVREACTRARPQSGIATIAAIEELFIDISADLGRGIVGRGWLPRELLVHYDAHEQLDRVHADLLHALLEPTDEVERGLAQGVTLMLDLYAGLLAS